MPCITLAVILTRTQRGRGTSEELRNLERKPGTIVA
jgi:hypothetical protein